MPLLDTAILLAKADENVPGSAPQDGAGTPSSLTTNQDRLIQSIRGTPPEMAEGAQGSDAAVRAAKNEVVLRDLNERLKAYPASRNNQRFSEWVCECADMTCMKPVELSIGEYEIVRAEPTRFLVAPGAEHVNPEIERVVQRERRYWVVEKTGVGAEITERFDPHS